MAKLRASIKCICIQKMKINADSTAATKTSKRSRFLWMLGEKSDDDVVDVDDRIE